MVGISPKNNVNHISRKDEMCTVLSRFHTSPFMRTLNLICFVQFAQMLRMGLDLVSKCCIDRENIRKCYELNTIFHLSIDLLNI